MGTSGTKYYLCGLLCVATNYSSLAGTPASDPVLARGEQIARQICSVCHVVAANQEYPPMLGAPTPSFIEIAHRPQTTAKGLQAFLKTTHWDDKTIPTGMPNPMLMPDQAAAVARYIMSLRGDSATQSR
jgi:mono/diheme cytochrome c family protein